MALKSKQETYRVAVQVKPGSRETRISIENGTTVVRVRERAHEGRANEACRNALAAALGVPANAIRLIGGIRSKYKRFEITGLGKPAIRNNVAAGLVPADQINVAAGLFPADLAVGLVPTERGGSTHGKRR